MVLIRVKKFILFLLGVLHNNRMGGRYFYGNGSCLMSFGIILDVAFKMCKLTNGCLQDFIVLQQITLISLKG